MIDTEFRDRILSLKAAAVVLKSKCRDDEDVLIANMDGRISALDQVLNAMKDEGNDGIARTET